MLASRDCRDQQQGNNKLHLVQPCLSPFASTLCGSSFFSFFPHFPSQTLTILHPQNSIDLDVDPNLPPLPTWNSLSFELRLYSPTRQDRAPTAGNGVSSVRPGSTNATHPRTWTPTDPTEWALPLGVDTPSAGPLQRMETIL